MLDLNLIILWNIVQQCNNISNKYGCILDLVLTTLDRNNIKISSDTEHLVPMDAYHPPLEILLTLPRTKQNPTSPTPGEYLITEWNFRQADFHSLYVDIANIDWTDLLEKHHINLDSAVDILYNKLNSVISTHVPTRTIVKSNKYNYPKWYTKEIIYYIKLKYFNLKKFKCYDLEFNRELFKYYRTKVKDLINIEFKNYISGVENNIYIYIEPSSFWQFVKEKRKTRQQIKTYTYKDKAVEGQKAIDSFA